MRIESRIRSDNEGSHIFPGKCLEGVLKIVQAARLHQDDRDADLTGSIPHNPALRRSSAILRIHEEADTGWRGYNGGEQLKLLRRRVIVGARQSSDVAPRTPQARDKALTNGVEHAGDDNRERASRLLRRADSGRHRRDDHIDLLPHKLRCQVRQPLILSARVAGVHDEVRTLDIAKGTHPLPEPFVIVGVACGRAREEKSNPPHLACLLRARRDRPRRRSATEHRDELAAPHSMTSSARCWRSGGTSRPSARAVLRLITNSNLTGAWTGSSLGAAPRRMRSA